MFKKQILIFILFINYSVIAVSDSKANIKTLNNFVKNVTTFSANFVQTQPDESTFSENKSKGYMAIKRPGKLFWIYQQPEHQEIVTDGKNLWIYDAEIDQVTVRALISVQADFPLRWLLYDEPVTDNFEVIVGDKINGVSWFNLVPKDNSFFQSLDVAISKGKLAQIWMYQSSDNIVKVVFEEGSTTKKILESQFDFVPPKGVDVIGHPLN